MQLEKLLKQPADSPSLHLREEMYGPAAHAELLQEVMGLANAEGGSGPRHIICGVTRDERGKIVCSGLAKGGLKELEALAGIVRQHLEPDLKVSPSFSEAQGHMVGVLEIAHCKNPPYMLKLDASAELRRGACWVREGGYFRQAQRADFDRMYKFSASMGATGSDSNIVRIGIGDDPNNKEQKFVLPDVLNSPSKVAATRMKGEIEAKKVTVEHEVTDSHIERLGHARLYGNASEFKTRGIDTLVENYEDIMACYGADDLYYFFETNALRLNLTLVNTGHEPLTDVSLVLSLPWVEEFRVSDMLHPPPGQPRTAKESELLGYPNVTIYDEAARVKCTFDRLEPDQKVPAFETDLRIGVQTGLAGKRVGIRYRLYAAGFDKPETGKLKLVFAK